MNDKYKRGIVGNIPGRGHSMCRHIEARESRVPLKMHSWFWNIASEGGSERRDGYGVVSGQQWGPLRG